MKDLANSMTGKIEAALLTTEEAAEYLNLPPTYLVRDRREGGRVRFVKLGTRTVRYRRTDLDDFVTGHLYSSTSEYTQGLRSTA